MKLYKQTTEYTCAVSSLMMILHSYSKDVKLNRETEFKIWQETVNLPTRAPSIYGLAHFAVKKGFNVKVLVEEREYNYPDYRFKGYTKKEIDEAKYMSKLHAKNLGKANVKVEEREILPKEIISNLQAGHKLLVRVNAGIFRETGSTSKYLAFIYENHSFKVYDPKKGVLETTKKDIVESLETLKSKKKRDKRVIIFYDS